ncbi:MAG: glycine cleavage system protein T, partial [Verrucomicrobia bacterium A1]
MALGARMAPFGGWDMPIQYEGILAEHAHTRMRTSIFDTCHMGEFDLSGPTAEADLEHLLTQRVSTIQAGQCRYGYLLREDGGALDDLTCYRRGKDHFVLVVNAGTLDADAEWIRSQLSPTTVFTDLSPRTAKLDIQGPFAREDMELVLGLKLPELKYFRFADVVLADTPCVLSRTGYTGEWGYELYFPWEEAVSFWELFLGNDQVKPAGLGARDTLRLEMAYPLYGHELSTERTPFAASRGQYVDWEKDFIGKPAMVRDRDQGVPQWLAGLQL